MSQRELPSSQPPATPEQRQIFYDLVGKGFFRILTIDGENGIYMNTRVEHGIIEFRKVNLDTGVASGTTDTGLLPPYIELAREELEHEVYSAQKSTKPQNSEE